MSVGGKCSFQLLQEQRKTEAAAHEFLEKLSGDGVGLIILASDEDLLTLQYGNDYLGEPPLPIPESDLLFSF